MAPRRRRSKGAGSVYRRADGLYVAALTLPDGRRLVRYRRRKADAEDLLKDLLREQATGKPLSPSQPTLAAYLRDWMDELPFRQLQPTTITRYALDARRWTVALGPVKLSDLTIAHIEAAQRRWLTEGRSSGTVVNARAMLRAALADAVRHELVSRNVAALAHPPPLERRELPTITVAHAGAILDAFAGHPLEALVIVAMGTGLRQGELLGLTWGDIDLDEGVLHVRRQLRRQGGAYTLTGTKSRASVAAVALPEFVISTLRARRSAQDAERARAGDAWQETGRVFTRPDGYYLNASAVTHRFQQQLAAASVPPITFHDLRRATGTLLAGLGVPLRVVMSILRHTNVATTACNYL